MTVQDLMAKYGFKLGLNSEGYEWYSRRMWFRGREAFVTVSDPNGFGAPVSLEEPVLFAIYDIESGRMLEESRRFESLSAFIEMLGRIAGSA